VTAVTDAFRFDFQRLGLDRFELVVRGELPLGWSAYVAGNLSDRGFDVDTARASQTADGTWDGRIEGARPLRSSSFPSASDLLVPLANPPVLIPDVRSYNIESSSDGSTLDVGIRATDQVGLLATLLRSFGMLGLFPRTFDVRTVNGMADDRFVLSGIGGSPASARSAQQIERSLSRWQGRSSFESLAHAAGK
jgi:hypothetical protein